MIMDNSTILALSGIGLFLFFLYFIVPLAMNWGVQKTTHLMAGKLRKGRIIEATKKRTFAGNLFYLYCWLMYGGWLIIMGNLVVSQAMKPWTIDAIGGILFLSFSTYQLTRYLYLLSQLRQPKTKTPDAEHP